MNNIMYANLPTIIVDRDHSSLIDDKRSAQIIIQELGINYINVESLPANQWHFFGVTNIPRFVPEYVKVLRK